MAHKIVLDKNFWWWCIVMMVHCLAIFLREQWEHLAPVPGIPYLLYTYHYYAGLPNYYNQKYRGVIAN